MTTSRFFKFVVIMLGAAGIICVGGGFAHADSVENSSQTAVNIDQSQSVSVNQSSSTPDSTATPPTVITTQTNQSSTTTIATVASGQNGETSSQAATVNESSPSSIPLAASPDAATPAGSGGSQPDSAPVTPSDSMLAATPSQTAVVIPAATRLHHIAQTVRPSDQTPVSADTAAKSGQPAPTIPAWPQSGSALVGASAVPASGTRLDAGGSTPVPGRTLGFTLAAILAVAIISAGLASTFVDFLKSSGFSLAPRGATLSLQFAFSLGEFDNGQWPASNSFFSRQLPTSRCRSEGGSS